MSNTTTQERISKEGNKITLYKQEACFNKHDYDQVVAHHVERANYHMQLANGYAERASTKFNKQMPLPFPAVQ